MKIVIDTKEDIHILRHVIQLLHAVSSAASAKQNYGYNTAAPSFFNDTPSSNSNTSGDATPPVTDAAPLFSMFDNPSSTPSGSSSDSFPSLFPGMTEEKKDNEKGDFLDSLEVY